MFEAYSVAVRLHLIDGVGAGIGILSGHFRSLNRDADVTKGHLRDIERQMQSIKKLGLVGGAMVGIGGLGLAMFKGPLEEAKKFQQEVSRFTSLGFGDKVNQDAVKFANGMNTYGTSARDNMSLVSDAMAVFKNLDHAKFAAPLMAKMKFANEAVFGEGGKANESKFMDMLKVIEFRRGLSSEGEFATQANFVQKVISGSRNRVDASQLLLALKTGGVALTGRSNEAFYLGSEPLIQEFGGSRYGTGAMSIYQNLVQARGTVTAQQELYRLGLLDKSKVTFNQLGQLKKALPGAFKGSSILEKEGELALLEKVLLPAFAAKGITGEENVIRELGMILGNRTGSSLMSRIFQQRAQIHMQSEANRSAMGIDELDATGRTTMAGKQLELHAKWASLMKELGTIVLPIAVRGLEYLNGTLKSAIAFAREFPVLTKGILMAFGALSAVVAVGGVLTLATAGFKALGLALSMSSAASGVGVGGSIARIVGIIGTASTAGTLLFALAGVAAIFGTIALLAPDKKNDGAAHVGQHWEGVAGGRIGHWAPNNRMVGPRGSAHAETWDGSKWVNASAMTSASAVSKSTGDIYMDGKKVGVIVSGHQAKDLSRPQSGTSFVDYTRVMPSPGFGVLAR